MLMVVATITLASRLESAPVAATPRGLTALACPWASPAIRFGLIATFFLQAARLGAYVYVGAIFAVRFGMDVSALGWVGLLVGPCSMMGALAGGTTLDRLAWHLVTDCAALLFIPSAVIARTAGQMWVALTSLALWFMSGAAFSSSQQTFLATADPSQRATIAPGTTRCCT